MDFPTLLEIVGSAPVFEASLLRAGDVDPVDTASQLSRWVRAGKLLRLRRGLYAVAPPYRAAPVEPFEVANALVRPSYVSEESALAFYGMIPEAVFSVSSMTTGRSGRRSTPLGAFDYRHVTTELFMGYRRIDLAAGRGAFVATPEKALLDLIYLRPRADGPRFLAELRLERLDRLDLGRLSELADTIGKPKLLRAARVIERMAEEQAEEYEEP